MITHKALFKLLKTLNIPVAYGHFDSNKEVSPPFLIYRETSPNTFKADGITYYRANNYELELVTVKKDLELEQSITTLLTKNKIPYDQEDDVWDNDEKIYHIFYEI